MLLNCLLLILYDDYFLMAFFSTLDMGDGLWGKWSNWTKPCRGNHYNGAQLEIFTGKQDSGFLGLLWSVNCLDGDDARGPVNIRLYCTDGTKHHLQDTDTPE